MVLDLLPLNQLNLLLKPDHFFLNLGSGKNGQVLKGDLIGLMGANPKPSERKIQYGQEERIKMTRLRQTIAKRLKQAHELVLIS